MALAVGTDVGGYEILARLKAGGMATLFLARRTGAAGFKRHVAVKIVHDHLAEDRDFVRMFVDEALLQARIHHPNVVHVEELGEANGQHFLVMEYVHGCSLSQLLHALAKRDRALSPELAVSIAMHVAAGLHAAHELRDETGQNLGVVHRDISPQNVLLAYEGHVKLIDFGVAKARNRAQQTAAGGLLKGKLRYMSPEQASGGAEVDRRTDVYALGIVLWEMLTMQKLFAAPDELQLLDLVRSPVIEMPSRIRPGVPAPIETVVMRALAYRPQDRYATANDFRRALAEASPTALLADASQLAELLGAVMTKEIEKEQKALPPSVSAVLAHAGRRQNVPPEAELQALKTMTISAAGALYLGDAGASRPSGSGMRPSLGAASAPSQPSASSSLPPRKEDLSTHVPTRRSGGRVALMGILALVALGAVGGAAYVGMNGMGAAPAEMSVTSLAAPPSAPAIVAPATVVTDPAAAAPPGPGGSPALAEPALAPSVVPPSVAPVVTPPPTEAAIAPSTPEPAAAPAPAVAPTEVPAPAATGSRRGTGRRRDRARDTDESGAPLATEF